MEVVGAVASFIAIAQALKEGHKALTFLRSIPEIDGEWRALYAELEAVNRIIDEAKQYQSFENPDRPDSDLLCASINRVKEIAEALVTLSRNCSRVPDQSTQPVAQANKLKIRPKKTKWLWVRDEIRILAARLRDAKTNLLLAVQLANEKQARAIPQAVCDVLMPVFEMKLEATSERTVRQLARLFDTLSKQPQVEHLSRQLEMGSNLASPNFKSETALSFPSREHIPTIRDCRIRTLCPQPCACRCHQALRGTLVSRAKCNSSTCERVKSAPSISGSIKLGYWLFGRAVSLTIGVSLRPQHVVPRQHNFVAALSSPHPSRELVRKAFLDVHPDDVDEFGNSMLLCVLGFFTMDHEKRGFFIENALQIWGRHLENGKIERRHYFEIQCTASSAKCPESLRHNLQILASFSEEHEAYNPTPIHCAILEQGSASAVRAAISLNPELIDTLDHDGETALHLVVSRCIENPRPLLFELGHAGADLHSLSGNGNPPLIDACVSHNVEAVRWLLEQGVDPSKTRSADGRLPLHVIANVGHGPSSAEIAQLLIDKGSDCNARSRMGHTPLHAFALHVCNGSFERSESHSHQLLATFVKGGANLEAIRDGETPILRAVRVNVPVSFLALIKHGADIRARNEYGAGILHLASSYCHSGMLNLIRESGAIRELDPFEKNNFGNSPWDDFIHSVNTPKEATHSQMDPSRDRCLAFEKLFLQVRDFQLQAELDYLQRAENCLFFGEFAEARVNLDYLVALREPKLLWAIDARMHTYRAIILQLQAENLEGALESMAEKREAIIRELSTSPWEMDSCRWHEWDYVPGATYEQWMEQDEIAQGWRREGLRRWRREHPLAWMAMHPDGCLTKGLFEIWDVFSDSDDDTESEGGSCGEE
ncbi:ankyrin repeat-containing domain protein [Plectosphaerella cucumerina]|uniref:Ankyrin repeat-containing domain protein n=1 Tax=Plectosphaerella cucumerina TaxID=40658 RepID=A0A8K0T5Q9_9PEZI|nr:ankyrin repeat-containing domain protein [Plectosphaerella cucumerina]